MSAVVQGAKFVPGVGGRRSSASTQNQALCALVFLYKRKSSPDPVVK